MVRLIKIEINNFKNVEHGEINFPNYQSVESKGFVSKSDILGIYGQNGSGKTAVVEALDIVKSLLSGNSVSFNDYAGIINSENKASIAVTYFIQKSAASYKVEYRFLLNRTNTLVSIPFESITWWVLGKDWKTEKMVSISNPYQNDSISMDVNAEIKLKGSGIGEIDFLNTPDKLAVRCASLGQSFFFNNAIQKIIKECSNKNDFYDILETLGNYSKESFYVIKVGQLAQINSQDILPLNISEIREEYAIIGCIPIFLSGAGLIPVVLYEKLNSIISSVNMALGAIIPNLKLEYITTGEETNPKGIKLAKVEMYSIRNGKRFSTKYESEGIKRIISLLSCLVSVFNNPNMSLVVDEFDSGIFEYLLGEILYSFDKEAKGQLIFTSHNLRAFEKLPNDSIVCSTTNPQNRYVKLIGINKNNNKRDFYIRALALGGQKETLYDCDELDGIGYALRKAGRKTEYNYE